MGIGTTSKSKFDTAVCQLDCGRDHYMPSDNREQNQQKFRSLADKAADCATITLI
jgi:hypothetical protein